MSSNGINSLLSEESKVLLSRKKIINIDIPIRSPSSRKKTSILMNLSPTVKRKTDRCDTSFDYYNMVDQLHKSGKKKKTATLKTQKKKNENEKISEEEEQLSEKEIKNDLSPTLKEEKNETDASPLTQGPQIKERNSIKSIKEEDTSTKIPKKWKKKSSKERSNHLKISNYGNEKEQSIRGDRSASQARLIINENIPHFNFESK